MVEMVIRREDAHGGVSTRPGDTLVLDLEENLSTGYSWQIVAQPSWCQLIESEHLPGSSGLMGAPGTHRFRLLIHGVGVGSLELSFRRAWEPPEAEVDHFSIQVDAR